MNRTWRKTVEPAWFQKTTWIVWQVGSSVQGTHHLHFHLFSLRPGQSWKCSFFINSRNFLFFIFYFLSTQKLFFSASQITPSMAVSSSSMCLNAGRLPPARSISSPSRLFPVTSFSPRSLLISDRRSLVSSSGSRLRFSALCVRDSKGTDDNWSEVFSK